MDLLTLPDEMLANVFKYANYSTIKRLRKMNRRIDKIAKTFDIGVKIPVASIRLSSTSLRHEQSMSWKYTLCIDSDGFELLQRTAETEKTEFVKEFDNSHGSHLDIIDGLLQKVKLNGSLKLLNFCHGINDSLLEIFIRNSRSLRSITEFILDITNVDCSEFLVKKFIGSSQKLRTYHIGYSENFMNAFFQIEMLENRLWDEISLCNCGERGIYPTFAYPRLSDEFLQKVVTNCVRCYIDFSYTTCTYFTVNGVIKMMEMLIEEENIPQCLDLGNVRSDGLSLEDVKSKILSIHSELIVNFDDYDDEEEDENGSVIEKHYCEVIFPSDRVTTNIEFRLVEESDDDEEN